MEQKHDEKVSSSPQKVKKLSIDEGFKLAIQFHQAGRFSEAQGIYKSILEILPDNAEVLHFYGVLSHQYDTGEDAVELIEKAIRVSPDYADAFNNLGNVYKERGDLQKAASAYRQVITLVANHAAAHNNLAAVLNAQGALQEALKVYKQAAELNPDDAAILYNLGNIARDCDDPDSAANAYRKAIEIDPEYADAHFQLGNLLKAQGARDQALDSYRRAVDLKSDKADYYFTLGRSFEEKGLLNEAAIVYRKVLALDDQYIDAYEAAVTNLYALNKVAEAIDLLHQWLRVDPKNPIAQHLLSAGLSKGVPERASDAYVERVFDEFADSFDTALDRVQYRAPQLSLEALEALNIAKSGQLDILDAGCGTGLCGPLFRPYARRLVGIDLSESMLEKARKRAVYDALEKTELTTYLKTGKAATAFDLIIAIDTLVYFGALQDVFEGMAGSLRAAGVLIFTLEDAADTAGGDGFYLNYHGRYSHSQAYVQNSLEQAGLRVRDVASVVLRREGKRAVAGLRVTACKVE